MLIIKSALFTILYLTSNLSFGRNTPTLEIYPFVGIVVHPRSDYMQELPFWNEGLLITYSEEE